MLTRGEVYEALREGEAGALTLEEGTDVKDFRQMYKLVEKVLTQLEAL